MKKSSIFHTASICLVFLTLFACIEKNQEDDFPVLTGPYLGQKPPGMTPEIFAPGLITTNYSQSYIAFLHEARICVYSASTEKGHETFYTYERNGLWTAPQRAPFEELQGHPNYTAGPLGRKVYFHSGRPTHPDDIREDDNIWTIEWTGSGWAEPEVLPPPASSDYGEAYPSAEADGTVYFFTWRRPGTHGYDIWVSRCIDGQFQEAERLPWPVNSDFNELDPYVAPDGSFLIFGSTRPGGYGKSDNYISFRKGDGSWTPPINLGRPFNSSSYDLCANGTPDGKYFFFISGRKTDVDKGPIGKKYGEESGEDSDLYWSDLSFINDLKNTVLTKQNAAEIIKQEYEENGIQSAIDTLNKLYTGQKDSTYFLPFALLSLCKNMIATDRTGDADIFFSALYDVLPKDLMIKEGYACVCAMNSRVSKALKILEELESEDPTFDLSDTLSGLGYLFTLYPDKTEEALSVLKFTVEKFPEDWFAYYSLARIYRQLGDLDKAIANCKKALEIRPSVGDISQLLERLLNEQEEKEPDNQKKESFPVLRGPHFGQKAPAGKAEVFMDGVISKLNDDEMCAAFAADGKEFYFNALHEGKWAIFMTREIDGKWTRPKPMPFTSAYTDRDFTLSPTGSQIFFGSNRPRKQGASPMESLDIFVTERHPASQWSEPKNIGYPINTDCGENYPSVAQNGNLYFFSSRENGFGGCDIYVSRHVDGRYLPPENLGAAVNSDKHDWDAVIAPDESFIIFSSQDREDSLGGQDLYIAYRKEEGGWTPAENMGPAVNSPYDEICPSLSLEGSILFFTSRRRGKADIFWIDARIIEDLRHEDNGSSQNVHPLRS